MLPLLFVAVAAAAAHAASGAAAADDDSPAWKQWKVAQARHYAGQREESARRAVFTHNLALINAHNAAADRGEHRCRARSHCHVVLPLIHVMPDSLTYSIPLHLKRPCDRTLGEHSFWLAANQFADMNHSQWVAQHGLVPHPQPAGGLLLGHPATQPRDAAPAASAGLPPSPPPPTGRQTDPVDWTDAGTCKRPGGCVTPVKNQGYC
jgi:hypothetical protein